jgi:hypothetical protein
MLCLVAGSVIASLGVSTITLSWTHSVEKITWEEVWRSTPAGPDLIEARVRGSGAGMDPPPEARLKNGAWAWKPQVPVAREVVLRRSGATADWRVCAGETCRTMDFHVPADSDPVVLQTCQDPNAGR